LGLEIIARALKPHCKSIDVVDLRFEQDLSSSFTKPETNLVCFSVNWVYERDDVAREISSINGNTPVLVGGRYATEDPEWWLTNCPNITMVVRSHGHEAAVDYANGKSPAEIAGVSYVSDGRIVHNDIRDIRSIPDSFAPDRSLRKYRYMVNAPDFKTGVEYDTVASSIGCPFNCSFCSFSRNPFGAKQSWAARSPEAVVDEIEQSTADFIGFVDDNFTHDMDRVDRFCDLVIERGIKKRFAANARIEIAKRPRVLRKMERAGFMLLLVGIESAQDTTLKAMRKGFDTARAREYFKVLSKSRMLFHGYFIVGNIGESKREMLDILPFAQSLGVDTISVNVLRSERYSGLEELVAENPGYHIDEDGYIYSDDLPKPELDEIRHTINKKFYSLGKIFDITTKLARHRIIKLRMLKYLPYFLLRAALGTFNPADRKGDYYPEDAPPACDCTHAVADGA
jgi:radical SAM superfamily enzyme YgiQ (UPF0313 family)